MSKEQPKEEFANASQEQDYLVIPEDFSSLNDAELAELEAAAVAEFENLYSGDVDTLSDENLEVLSSLAEGVKSIQAELSTRKEAAAERASKAEELASSIKLSGKAPAEEEKDEEEAPAEEEKDEEEDEEKSGEEFAAPARKELRITKTALSKHLPKDKPSNKPTAKDFMFAAGEGHGYASGIGIDWEDVGKIVDKRLKGKESTYSTAARAGQHVRQQLSIMSVRKPHDPELVVENRDASDTERVLRKASSESRLSGNSLTASGGWCAPSETLYDVIMNASSDGLISLPEVNVKRGGINRTLGPDFSVLYANSGFAYTEAEDIAGDYDGAGGGSKPCFRVPCPTFEDIRMGVTGLCLSAGLLQLTGYPEYLAAAVQGALVAHDHRTAAKIITDIKAGSDAVPFTTDHSDGTTRTGAAAPTLSAIEIQVEHMRSSQRLSRTQTIEVILPYWVRGAIRADLSRRQGVNLLDVSDAMIDGWFRVRGVSPQFVYNMQDLSTVTSAAAVDWPQEVEILMYPAGTWVRGVSDVITVDTLFDSTQLGSNDYTALFTEEGYMVIKMDHDSRSLTVPISVDGVTHFGIDLVRNGISL